jgi:hypothetical protein
MKALSFFWTVAAAAALTGLALSGCQTKSYCFANCDGESSGGGASAGGGSGSLDGGLIFGGGNGGGTFFIPSGGGADGGGSGCIKTSETEVCGDGLDNDCDGLFENADTADIDFTDPRSCGTCARNCRNLVKNADPNTVT